MSDSKADLETCLALCMAARRELQGRLNARDATIEELEEQLSLYVDGYQGACMACEPVALQNQRLEDDLISCKVEIKRLREKLKK